MVLISEIICHVIICGGSKFFKTLTCFYELQA